MQKNNVIKKSMYLLLAVVISLSAVLAFLPGRVWADDSVANNLFNPAIMDDYFSDENIGVNSVDVDTDTGSIVIAGVTVDDETSCIYISNDFTLSAGEYTLSFFGLFRVSNMNYPNFYIYSNTDNALVESFSFASTDNPNGELVFHDCTFTLAADSSLYFKIEGGGPSHSGREFTITLDNIMLNNGSTPADFVPYSEFEPTEPTDPDPMDPTEQEPGSSWQESFNDWLRGDSGIGLLSVGSLAVVVLIGVLILRKR